MLFSREGVAVLFYSPFQCSLATIPNCVRFLKRLSTSLSLLGSAVVFLLTWFARAKTKLTRRSWELSLDVELAAEKKRFKKSHHVSARDCPDWSIWWASSSVSILPWAGEPCMRPVKNCMPYSWKAVGWPGWPILLIDSRSKSAQSWDIVDTEVSWLRLAELEM